MSHFLLFSASVQRLCIFFFGKVNICVCVSVTDNLLLSFVFVHESLYMSLFFFVLLYISSFLTYNCALITSIFLFFFSFDLNGSILTYMCIYVRITIFFFFLFYPFFYYCSFLSFLQILTGDSDLFFRLGFFLFLIHFTFSY